MKRIALIALIAVALAACTKVENHRIPYSSVNIALDNTGLWDTYGVHALGDCRIFNKSQIKIKVIIFCISYHIFY